MVALQLEMEYTVRTVYGGPEALEAVDRDTDVVLLDRRMPELSGDEVLAAIRDRGLDCRVVMVSAVSPDYDVLEMPFDDYLCKPVAGETLLDGVAHQLRVPDDDDASEYLRLVAKRGLLEDSKPAYELEEHEGYRELVARTEALREELDADGEVGALAAAIADLDRT